MTILVPITLFGWVPAVLLFFMWLPPRRAVITAFMVGWLFLPAATFNLPGIPDYSKMAATCVGILLAALIFDLDTLLSFRPRWFDIPMLIWCLYPFGTNSTENIDIYDSVSWSVAQFITFGMPYFIGRVYFTDAQAVRELAIGFFISGLVYIPICLFEIRMSPQLSKWLYGFEGGYSGRRLGGWRPTGLLASGLMLGMWMTSASMLGVWLWFTGSIKRVGRYGAGKLVFALVVTTIMCKSTGALLLLTIGLGCLFTIRYLKFSFPVLFLCLPAIVYPVVRCTNAWDGAQLVEFAKHTVGPDRAQSIEFRFKNERILAEKAMQRFWWGWGRGGRSRVLNEYGKDISTTDGFWIIVLGTSGVIGLAAMTSIFVLPTIRFWWRSKGTDWSDPAFSAIAGLSVILTLYSIDNILNAMLNPVITLCMGALGAASLRRPVLVEVAEPAVQPYSFRLRKISPRRALWPPVDPGRQGSADSRDVGVRGRSVPNGRRPPPGPHRPR